MDTITDLPSPLPTVTLEEAQRAWDATLEMEARLRADTANKTFILVQQNGVLVWLNLQSSL